MERTTKDYDLLEEYLGSQKDIEDANHLRIVYSEKINQNLIKEWKEQIKEVKL